MTIFTLNDYFPPQMTNHSCGTRNISSLWAVGMHWCEPSLFRPLGHVPQQWGHEKCSWKQELLLREFLYPFPIPQLADMAAPSQNWVKAHLEKATEKSMMAYKVDWLGLLWMTYCPSWNLTMFQICHTNWQRIHSSATKMPQLGSTWSSMSYIFTASSRSLVASQGALYITGLNVHANAIQSSPLPRKASDVVELAKKLEVIIISDNNEPEKSHTPRTSKKCSVKHPEHNWPMKRLEIIKIPDSSDDKIKPMLPPKSDTNGAKTASPTKPVPKTRDG